MTVFLGCYLGIHTNNNKMNNKFCLNKMTPQNVITGVQLEAQDSSLVHIKPAGKPFALVFSGANELETLHQQP